MRRLWIVLTLALTLLALPAWAMTYDELDQKLGQCGDEYPVEEGDTWQQMVDQIGKANQCMLDVAADLPDGQSQCVTQCLEKGPVYVAQQCKDTTSDPQAYEDCLMQMGETYGPQVEACLKACMGDSL